MYITIVQICVCLYTHTCRSSMKSCYSAVGTFIWGDSGVFTCKILAQREDKLIFAGLIPVRLIAKDHSPIICLLMFCDPVHFWCVVQPVIFFKASTDGSLISLPTKLMDGEDSSGIRLPC